MSFERAKKRNGLTLTELLVVVSIMVVVAGALVPLVQPIMKGRNTREAVRQLNVMISGAQARAVAKGRPVGIWLERAAHEPNEPPDRWYAVYKVFYAEEPTPYTGDFYDSRVMISQNDQKASDRTIWHAVFTPGTAPSAIKLVRPGDSIRLNQRGPRYPVISLDPLKVSFRVSPTTPMPFSPQRYINQPMGTRYEVFRQPKKSMVAPIEMPNNTAIDLSVSGYSTLGNPTPTSFRLASPEYDVAMMFSPDGGIDTIYYISHEPNVLTFSERPAGNVSLLIGRSDKIGQDLNKVINVTNDYQQNAQGPMGLASLEEKTNIWMTIASHSGRTQSGPNAGLSLATLANLSGNPNAIDARTLIGECRQFADTGQSLGGR